MRTTLVSLDLTSLDLVTGGAAASRASSSRPAPELEAMLVQVQDAVRTMAKDAQSASSPTMLPMMMLLMLRR